MTQILPLWDGTPFPDLIRDLPEIDVPIQGVRGWLLQGPAQRLLEVADLLADGLRDELVLLLDPHHLAIRVDEPRVGAQLDERDLDEVSGEWDEREGDEEDGDAAAKDNGTDWDPDKGEDGHHP